VLILRTAPEGGVLHFVGVVKFGGIIYEMKGGYVLKIKVENYVVIIKKQD